MPVDKWADYQQLVLHELQTHSEELKAIREDLKNLHIEIAYLKIKSGVWGIMGGAIPVIVFYAISVLTKHT